VTPSVPDGLLLGLVQGLTEFLPVSSSGHLVLAEAVLDVRSPGLFVEIGLHVATLASVLIAFRSRVAELLGGLARGERDAWRYAGLLLLASVPAGIAGLTLRDAFASRFTVDVGLGLSFLATAAILWSTRRVAPRADRGPPSALAALGIGLAQAVAILPGVSRSGTTIAAALWAGVAPARAAEFSFFLAVIAIAGSAALEVHRIPPGVSLLAPGLLAGFGAALASGIWAIRFLVRLLRGGVFHRFAWYCAALGLVSLGWAALSR